MRHALRIAALIVSCTASALAPAVDKPTLLTAKEIKWVDVAEPAGAQQAELWASPDTRESAILTRWKFNSKLPERTRAQDVHVFVIAGTFTVETEGTYREFGPGGFVSIPKGTKHIFGCEAAGECRFIVHHPGR